MPFSSYDDWKTTDPRDMEPGLEAGQVECPFCNGEGHGPEDGGWYCRECNGEGWMWEDQLAAMEAELEAENICPRCGCDPCDCEAIAAMRTAKPKAPEAPTDPLAWWYEIGTEVAA